ncbi:MAG: YihY/virulence factor BrkB family protein [Clostridium sp.]|nr:YihY/virulence factor BrkB family protein [Clostridium sp.]MDY3827975.1 YihY/virulence factor BrkB family protein [Clostridium sp.]
MSKEEKKQKKKISKLNFLVSLIVKVNKDDVTLLAAQVAYYLVLSFFPFLFSLSAIIGLMNLDYDLIMNWLNNVLPSNVVEFIRAIIIEINDSQNSSILIMSLATGLWISSRAADSIIIGVNKAYGLTDKRNYIKRKFIACLSTLGLVLSIVLSLIVLVFGKTIETFLISKIPFPELFILIWSFLRYGIIIFILIFIFASIYKFVSSEKLKWKEVFPGAVISVIGWILASWIFALYIENFNNYSKFYGSIAAIFILMVWLYLTALILLFGAEVNSVLKRNE